jgi:hypothetical protein
VLFNNDLKAWSGKEAIMACFKLLCTERAKKDRRKLVTMGVIVAEIRNWDFQNPRKE